MPRTFAHFAILLIAFENLANSVLAESPLKELPSSPFAIPGAGGALSLSGSNANVPNFTTITGGNFNTDYREKSNISGNVFDPSNLLSNDNANAKPYDVTASGLIVFNGVVNGSPTIAVTRPVPSGPTFYIITQGASQGISVRSMACTGNDTVLSAASSLSDPGIFIKKVWIARPAAKDGVKTKILAVDWEAISKQGDNTTNYKLLPGDRLVFGAAASATQAKPSASTGADNKEDVTVKAMSKSEGKASSHELAMQPLPAYRIEPPDIIQIELLKLKSVSGQYLVGPDGTVNMRRYGRVIVSGLTIVETQAAIQKQLAIYLKAPEPTVDVVAYNSKIYYLIVQDTVKGDTVHRFPITGNETVLDAISQVNGLSSHSSKNIWISRPSISDPKKGERLQIDWDAITSAGATATNYQIYPGDRVYIAEDPLKVAQRSAAEKGK